MQVWIQKVEGEFYNANTFTAWKGFEFFGWETLFYDFSQIEELVNTNQITRETPVVGGIPCVLKALELLGCAQPQLESLPPSLEKYFGRRVWIQTLGEVRAHINAEKPPLFIKPLPCDHKLFKGHVVGAFRDLILTSGVELETPISCCEVVDFAAEYRGFVHQGELVGFRHYFGDFRFYPEMNLVDEAIGAYENRPVACSMDWGVTREGKTLLVEVNDAHSLGCYGLDPLLYAPMLRDRWLEMAGLPAN